MPLFPPSFPRPPLPHRARARRPRASVPETRIAPGRRWHPPVHPTCHPNPSLHLPPAAGKGKAGGRCSPRDFPRGEKPPMGKTKENARSCWERCIVFMNPSPGGRARTPVGAWVPRGERDPGRGVRGGVGVQGCVPSMQTPDGRLGGAGGAAFIFPLGPGGRRPGCGQLPVTPGHTHPPHREGGGHPPNPKPAPSQRSARRSLPPGQDFPVKPQPRQTKG